MRHSQAEAVKAEAKREGFTPPMPGSVPLKSPAPKEIGVDPQQPVKVADLGVHIVPVPPPADVAPDRPPSPLIEKVSSSDAAEMDPETRRAVNDLFNGWDVRAPRTDIVLTPAVERSLEGNGRSDAETPGGTAAAPAVAVSAPRTVLRVPLDAAFMPTPLFPSIRIRAARSFSKPIPVPWLAIDFWGHSRRARGIG